MTAKGEAAIAERLAKIETMLEGFMKTQEGCTNKLTECVHSLTTEVTELRLWRAQTEGAWKGAALVGGTAASLVMALVGMIAKALSII